MPDSVRRIVLHDDGTVETPDDRPVRQVAVEDSTQRARQVGEFVDRRDGRDRVRPLGVAGGKAPLA